MFERDARALEDFLEQVPPWKRTTIVPAPLITKYMGHGHQEKRRHYAEKHNEELELMRKDSEVAIYYTDAALGNKNATIAYHLLNNDTWAYPTSPDIPEEAQAQTIPFAIGHMHVEKRK
ncbi:MAG: hypothetical protein O7D30_12235 [Rickettsia endosymbiont of Ixodes persulcatus]|nr:hypothetical protein [Rickettsia endosymbiont of Ixodes persulcatus]